MQETRASILVVDDDELIRDLFTRHLTHAGYVVSTAAGGTECLQTLQRECFDLLLLDINMPDMDGRDVLQQIRNESRHQSMPIVMLSAIRDKSVVVKALYLGASDYLVKPCNWVVVKQRLARLLATHAAGPSQLGAPVLAESARLLVVDDDELSRELLCARMRSAGFRAVQAASGNAALRLMAEDPPDLVLLDRMMPGIDGGEVLRRMKADARLQDIPVIVISALDDSDSISAMLDEGADDYITKPYHAVILTNRVQGCLVQRQRTQAERERVRRLQELNEIGQRIRAERDPA